VIKMKKHIKQLEINLKDKRGMFYSAELESTVSITRLLKDDFDYMNAKYIEVLLLLDENWLSTKNLRKYSETEITNSELNSFLKEMKDRGLIESKPYRKHSSLYRRVKKLPKHKGGNY